MIVSLLYRMTQHLFSIPGALLRRETSRDAEDVEILKAPQASKANAHCERVIGTLRREVLDHILIMNTTE